MSAGFALHYPEMNRNALPLWTGLLPMCGIIISYVIAATLGHVEACFPLIAGCTSISSAGRMPPESYVFRGALIPSAVLLSFYWRLNTRWLQAAGDGPSFTLRALPYLGLFAAVFLVVYASVLGAIGEVHALQRRIAVTLFFSSSLMAQLLFTLRLVALKQRGALGEGAWVVTAKLWICSLMVLTGLMVIPKYVVGWDTDNLVEWNFALLSYSYYAVTYFLWRR